MQDLKALNDALATGLKRGALIHEKTGRAIPVEVLATEGLRVIGTARPRAGDEELFRTDAKVRIELPLDGAVIFIPGKLGEFRIQGDQAELDMRCDGSENRQRRMEVRIDAECRIRLSGGAAIEETRTVNISAGGALVVSDSRAKVGEQVDVELEIDGRLVRCKAEVLRRGVKTNGAPSRTSAALKFLGLPPELKEQIALYVLKRQASEKLERNR